MFYPQQSHIKSNPQGNNYKMASKNYIQHCLVSPGETYGLTAQHMQDSPISFIQLNYVHKNKALPPYVKFPCHKVAQHWEFYFLFLISAILHCCIFGNSCFLSVEISFKTRHPSTILFDCVGLYLWACI